MNSQLLKFLIEHHTINGDHIKIDESEGILGETVKRINEHQSTDVDVMESQLIESDLIEKLVKACVSRNVVEVVCVVMDLDKLAESNLKELISDLLRAS